MSFTLITTIVSHGKGDKIMDAAVKAGSSGGTVLHGRGISPNAIAAALGIESTKDIVFILAENESKSSIYNAILDATKKEHAHLGCMFTSPAGQLIKNGTVTGEEMLMPENNSQDLITVILNSGYADDAMDAARKAGAGGGTVIKARGTARPDDPQFFGMHIVPEKETLLIVVPHEKKDAVLDAIKNLECLSQPGSGIAYCSPVNEFVLLGKK
ncbi:MAG: transcriptional regulator [Treponema sp.]|nr:transcriptional regulator [Treponema sp.]